MFATWLLVLHLRNRGFWLKVSQITDSILSNTVVHLATDKALSPESYIILPFLSSTDNEEYGALLAERIDAFRNVRTPIDHPKLPETYPTSPPALLDTSQPVSLPPSSNPTFEENSSVQPSGNGRGISTGALVGIVILVVIVLALAAGRTWRKDRNYDLAQQRAPAPLEGQGRTNSNRC